MGWRDLSGGHGWTSGGQERELSSSTKPIISEQMDTSMDPGDDYVEVTQPSYPYQSVPATNQVTSTLTAHPDYASAAPKRENVQTAMLSSLSEGVPRGSVPGQTVIPRTEADLQEAVRTIYEELCGWLSGGPERTPSPNLDIIEIAASSLGLSVQRSIDAKETVSDRDYWHAEAMANAADLETLRASIISMGDHIEKEDFEHVKIKRALESSAERVRQLERNNLDSLQTSLAGERKAWKAFISKVARAEMPFNENTKFHSQPALTGLSGTSTAA